MPLHQISDHLSALLQEVGDKIITPAFNQAASTKSIKADGSVVTETDLSCQQHIQSRLSALYPGIDFLGEEMGHDEQLAALSSSGRFWCVDPLDGTSNFTVPLPHFASSVALIEDGEPVVACIHDPLAAETFTAIKGEGARMNGRPINCSGESELKRSVGFVDFKRLDSARATLLVTEKIYHSQRNIGTCALEWAWLATGRGHFIIHGGEKIWDYAAGALIAAESGCITTDFDGHSPFCKSQLSSPILAACHAEIHRQLFSRIRNR